MLTKIQRSVSGKYNLVVITPDDYTKDKKYPLVVFLPGIGAKGDNVDMLVNETPNNLKRWANLGFIIVAVQTPDTYNDEVLFAREYALNNYSIGAKYLTGLSYGGGGTWNFAGTSLEQAKMFDAIAPIASTWTTGNWANIANANLPVWAFHNKYDNNGGTPSQATITMVNEVNKLKPGLAVMTLFNSTVHGGWDEAYNPDSPPVAIGGEGLTNPTKTLAQWFLMNDAAIRISVPAATVQSGLQPFLEYKLEGNTVYLDGSKSFGMKSAKLATVKVPDGVNIYNANIEGGGTAVGKITLTKTGIYRFRLTVYPGAGYTGTPATAEVEVNYGTTATPFTPTHTIVRGDGTKEQVRIETI